MPSNQQYQHIWSTETPTAETTIVLAIKQLNLFNKYLLLVTLRPTITIRFDSKFQIIAQLFDSIRKEKKQYLHSTTKYMYCWICCLTS